MKCCHELSVMTPGSTNTETYDAGRFRESEKKQEQKLLEWIALQLAFVQTSRLLGKYSNVHYNPVATKFV